MSELRVVVPMIPPSRYAARFNRYVSKTDSCWIWTGSRSKGYGDFTIRHVKFKSHRIAWVLATGQWPPDNLCVLHRCDNPSCVNPDHLFLGTNADNVADRHAKGRDARVSGDANGSRLHPERLPSGVDHHRSKINPDKAREIRSAWRSGARQVDLALRYGLNQGTVSAICRNVIWKEVSRG
jgi:hypothetical protein